MPEKPASKRTSVACYDYWTGSYLNCPFTHKIMGLKEPAGDNNGGHDHPGHPLINPPGRSLQYSGTDRDGTPLGIDGDTERSIAYIAHPLPEASGNIVTESVIGSPPRWQCAYNCFTRTESKYEDTLYVGITLAELTATASDNFVFKPPVARDAGHPDRHSGTQELFGGIKLIAKVYNEITDRKPRITDMSLPFGGLFDLNKTWTADIGHNSHRTGHDVDFSSIDDGGRSINCLYENTDEMKKAFENFGDAYRKCYSNGSYHVRVL